MDDITSATKKYEEAKEFIEYANNKFNSVGLSLCFEKTDIVKMG